VDTRETREAYGKYLAEIEYMDAQVGKALELLKKHDLEEETVFIFTSEQGNSFPYAKWTCYNAGLHTGFIVRWPGMTESSAVSDCLIDYSDVVPTFLDIAGLRVSDELDGRSIKDILLGKACSPKTYSFGMQTTRGIFFGSDFFGIRSVTDGHFRYIVNLTPEVPFKNAVTNGKHAEWWQSWLQKAEVDETAKQTVDRYQRRPAIELYDDLNDPFNQVNLAGRPEFSAKQKELATVLARWMEACGDKGQETELNALKHQKK
jgi:uncharacterized sulfatase